MITESIPQLLADINTACAELDSVRLMEVCGTHTVSLFRSGVKSLLPKQIKLISGPGCPVCVTSQGYLDVACELAGRQDVTICTYGDMVRVPGRSGSLETMRAQGAKVRVVYSPRDAVIFAAENPQRTVVFLAVGFETTTPGTAAAVIEARQKNMKNFFILPGHKLVVPAMMILLQSGEVGIDGFLCPGHVSIVIGADAYRPIVEQFGKGCVVAGFEAADMLQGILLLSRQLAEKRPAVENAYPVAVKSQGNPNALKLINDVFEPADAVWRAMGTLPMSGLKLRDKFRAFDALEHFGLTEGPDVEPPGCRCGEVIQGKVEPKECSLFRKRCTPMSPVGPCMVSSEGTCSAWYKYGG
ncbi:MAG: hydrogenase formation protein HypD [Sedimentisphaerales bacterium]|nr:hydrogenase formation protein HypD [Sedimentisphaerales bacterium]